MSSACLNPSREVLHEPAGDLFARRERGAVHDEVEPAVRLLDLREDRGDLVVVGDVERQHHRPRRQRVGQLADVLFETALIGEDESGAAPSTVACAIAQASERWFATPTIRPTFPVKSAISGSSCRRAGGVRRPAPGPAPSVAVALAVPVIAETHRPEVVLTAAARRTPASAAELVLAAGVALAVVVASIVAGIES